MYLLHVYALFSRYNWNTFLSTFIAFFYTVAYLFCIIHLPYVMVPLERENDRYFSSCWQELVLAFRPERGGLEVV